MVQEKGRKEKDGPQQLRTGTKGEKKNKEGDGRETLQSTEVG